MSESIEISWAKHTVIDQEELEDYITKVDSWGDGTLNVDSWCIKPSAGNLNQGGLVDFLKKQLPRFVFSPAEQDNRDWPGQDAPEFLSYKEDHDKVGIVGELLLFLLVDALLEMPMICHKVSLKQEPMQPVKGSDGLFYGQFDGTEALGIGEAKFKRREKAAIREALEGTEQFHGASGHSKKQFEVDVASRTLSDDLNDDEVKQIVDALGPKSTGERTIHPIFIGYEDDSLGEFQSECTDADSLMNKIEDQIAEQDLESYIQDKIKNGYTTLDRYWVIFFLFPVEDTTEFKKQWQYAVFPTRGED